MKYIKSFLVVIFACCSMLLVDQSTNAQGKTQEITGTLIGFDGPGIRTAFFTLQINSLTSDEQANQNRGILQEGGKISYSKRFKRKMSAHSQSEINWREQLTSRANHKLTAKHEFLLCLNAGCSLPKFAAVIVHSIFLLDHRIVDGRKNRKR